MAQSGANDVAMAAVWTNSSKLLQLQAARAAKIIGRNDDGF